MILTEPLNTFNGATWEPGSMPPSFAPPLAFLTTEEYEAGSGNADAAVISVPFNELWPRLGDATVPRDATIPFSAVWPRLEAVKLLAERGISLEEMTEEAVTAARTGTLHQATQKDPVPLPTPKPTKGLTNYHRTDLGNAEYFKDMYGHVLRFDSLRRTWLEWVEHHWQLNGRAAEMGQRAARRRSHEATVLRSMAKSPSKDLDELVAFAHRSEYRYAIDSALSLAKDMSGILVNTSDGWDADPWLLGVPNGVVDLRIGVRRDGSPDDHITKQAGAPFDVGAACPRFERFICEVLGGDQDLITFLRRALGYTLSGRANEDCWFGCYGEGQNGKSTLLKVLQSVLGDYAYVAPMSLVQRGGSGTRPDFQHAYLQNRRLVVASETREGSTWDEEQLKKLSGGDVVHAEIKHGAEFNFYPTHKLWFMFNHKPRVADHSLGFWRRVRLIPFTQKFDGSRRDTELDVKLAHERPGILAWLVRACLEWQKEGLPTPQVVLDASRQYEVDEDPLGEFLQLHVSDVGPGFYLQDAYWLYKEWAKAAGLDLKFILGRNRFSQMLELRGFKRGEKRNRPFFPQGKLVFSCTCMQTRCTCLPTARP